MAITDRRVAIVSEQQGVVEARVASLDQQVLVLTQEIQAIARSINTVEEQAKTNTFHTNNARTHTDSVQASVQEGGLRIQDSSSKLEHMLEHLLSVISDIQSLLATANRIKILGVNASIEAAHAQGVDGQRFAVVAQEMATISNSMRDQLINVTNRLQSLIAEVHEIQAADHGVQQSFDAISGKVGELVGLINKIGEASEDQSQGIHLINTNIQNARSGFTILAASNLAVGAMIYQQSIRLGNIFETPIIKNERPSKELLLWGPELMLGVESIDKQHKVLVDSINRIFAMLQSLDLSKESSKRTIKHEVQILVAYTLEHFRFEQEWMDAAGFSLALEHKEEHDRIVEQVSGIIEKFDTEDTAYVCISLMSTLQGWLINHILGSDKKYLGDLQEGNTTQPKWLPVLKRT